MNWLNLSDINSKNKISGISEYGTRVRLCIRGHVMGKTAHDMASWAVLRPCHGPY